MFLASLYGVLFFTGVVGLFFSNKLRNKAIAPTFPAFIGLNEKNEGSVFHIRNQIDINFGDMLSVFGVGDEKFYTDPKKIGVSYNGKTLLIEDGNVKNMLFVNKRRVKKIVLKDGDVLETGGIKLMYLNSAALSRFNGTRSGIKYLNNKNLSQTLPGHLPYLVSFDSRKKTTVLSKNLTYIGKSETNDLVLKIKDASFKHALIKRISGKYKLIDLNSKSGTYINGKKFDEKFLNHGDEISFDAAKYKIVYPKTSHVY